MYSYSQDFITIATTNVTGRYGGSFGGGIQQMVGGYFSLNDYNGSTSKTYIMGIKNIL